MKRSIPIAKSNLIVFYWGWSGSVCTK